MPSTLTVQKSNDDEQVTNMQRVSCGIKTTVYGLWFVTEFLNQLVNAEINDTKLSVCSLKFT